MFDFWKEVVINSAKVDGKLKIQNTDDFLRVLRCADYHKKGIVGGVIYRTVPTDPVYAKVPIPTVEGADNYRLVLDIRLVGHTEGSFAQPWSVFKKPVIVEFSTVEKLKKTLKAIVPADYAYIKLNGNTIECGDPHMVFAKAVIEKVGADDEYVEYLNLLADKDAVKAGKPAVGSGKWILENLRFPTNANLRYAAPNGDEMPIEGAKYVQYAFEYSAPNRGLHGQGTVGQEMTSVTHHVFYVHEDVDANITGVAEGTKVALKDLIEGKAGGTKIATVKNVAFGAETAANTETATEEDARTLENLEN